MIVNNNYELIGNTPVIKLNKLMKKYNLKSEIYLKLEYFNMAGSIKDRPVLNMIMTAKEEGIINDNSTIVEPTSGNTGIAIAAMGANMGLKVVLVMPDSASIERVKIMKYYGAQVILTDSSLGMNGSIAKAQEIIDETPNSLMLSQFENANNPLAHYKQTAKEISKDFNNDLDYFVAGIGTGGTVSGVGKYLKEHNTNIKVFGIEPANSPFLTKGIKGKHKIDGIGAGLLPKNLNFAVLDGIITVQDEDVLNMQKEIATVEGLFVGISSAANVLGMIKLIENKEDLKILTTAADNGERYLSKLDI
ncbi:MAG: cysteine synthase A [Erysipelotrichaceae bacterium]